jgi:hypothetical protein
MAQNNTIGVSFRLPPAERAALEGVLGRRESITDALREAIADLVTKRLSAANLNLPPEDDTEIHMAQVLGRD